jgi:hypothetical protein
MLPSCESSPLKSASPLMLHDETENGAPAMMSSTSATKRRNANRASRCRSVVTVLVAVGLTEKLKVSSVNAVKSSSSAANAATRGSL